MIWRYIIKLGYAVMKTLFFLFLLSFSFFVFAQTDLTLGITSTGGYTFPQNVILKQDPDDLKYPDTEPSRKVPPWDHLRENKFSDIPSWLNRLREHEYRTEFEKYFDIIEWLHTDREGETLLTDDISRELSNYTNDELLTKGFVVIACPKK